MLKGTIKALKASIQHWKNNENGTDWSKTSVGAKNCALCHRFNSEFEEGCERYSNSGEALEKCPVHLETGKEDCCGSPYGSALAAHWDKNDLAIFKTAATKERKFLESLLPEGDKISKSHTCPRR